MNTGSSVAPFRHAFDEVISPLSGIFRRQADALLDLRACALSRSTPGRCVACYFALFAATSAREVVSSLCPLKNWLENEIEVVARNETDTVLETVPLRLEAEDLESYCRGVMDEMREDRVHPGASVLLEFRFKDEGRTAA